MPTCLACSHPNTEHWAIASDEEYFSTQDLFNYYRCKSCGVLFIDPVPRERLNQIYPRNYYSFDESVTNSPVSKVKDWLDQRFFKKFISPLSADKIKILDVGGGNGRQLSSLKKLDPRISHTAIVDLNQEAGEVARKLGHEYFCGRFEDYEPRQLFDVILLLNLIEHVDNPQSLLEKARKLLSPEGIIIIKTPNTDSLDARLFRNKNWGGYHCPRHWVLFDRPSFEVLMKRTGGLKIRSFSYTQGAPFWTTSILFAMTRNKWIQTSKERPVPKHPLCAPFNAAFASLDLLRSTVAKTSQMMIVLGRG